VIDKDYVAALLAIALDARQLLFLTDVPHASRGFGTPGAVPIRALTPDEARAALSRSEFAPGSMAPKIESALAYAEKTGRPALITTLGDLPRALAGQAGTRVLPTTPRSGTPRR
jgi:carbamate kinase